jgi:hypothetical protein
VRERTKRVLGMVGVLALLAAASCSFTPAMQAYCEETQSCFCAGGDCCIKSANSCEDDLCCGRLLCGDGQCVKGPNMPFLAIDPPGVDFGRYQVTGPDPAPTQVFTVTNVGDQPTAPLQRRTTGSAELVLREDTCLDTVLQPGASCSVRVDVVAASLGPKALRFAYFEAPDVDTTVVVTVFIDE